MAGETSSGSNGGNNGGSNGTAAVRIRRILIAPVVDHYGHQGELLKTVSERPVEMCEADFAKPVAEWLLAAGVPPEVLGLVPRSAPPPPPAQASTSASTSSTSTLTSTSTAVSDTLLPPQYVVSGGGGDHEP